MWQCGDDDSDDDDRVFICCSSDSVMGRDSPVGIATLYDLDGPRIESRWGRDFPRRSRPALGPTQPPVQQAPGLFTGVNRPDRGVEHRLPSTGVLISP